MKSAMTMKEAKALIAENEAKARRETQEWFEKAERVTACSDINGVQLPMKHLRVVVRMLKDLEAAEKTARKLQHKEDAEKRGRMWKARGGNAS